ncbi:MAG: GNAT family N-acetyltransferase [Polyangiaceae bacterium]
MIRTIRASDDATMATIIRDVMTSFGCVGAGFSISDPEVDTMSAAYARPRHWYGVVEVDGRVLGGGGVAPLVGGDEDLCELRKMYFLPEARGLGWGQKLLDTCLERAREAGFRRCYLETKSGMDAARALYLRNGFASLEGPLGATGHGGCDQYFLRAIGARP